jgi:acetyl esterase/lipase
MRDVSEFERRVRALGANFGLSVLEATRNIYREHIALPEARETRDISYGPDQRHKLDLYLPYGEVRGVVVFVHGGGFTGGDKNEDGTFYPNVGRFLANAGYAAVLPNYRRAPQFGWPSASQDVRDAIAWCRLNRPAACSDTPFFVWGQSAGAAHVATWLFDDETRGAPLGRIDGVLLMSGYYHPCAPMSENARAYFGDDSDLYERRSALRQVKPVDVPLWISVAELDPGAFAARSFELAQKVSLLQGRAPNFTLLRGHNHVSTVLSLGSGQTDSGDSVIAFLKAASKPHRVDEPS